MAEITALYRFFGADGTLLYIGITANLPARLGQHRDDKPWWSEVAKILVEHYPSREIALVAERTAIEAERPGWNVVHNGSRGLSVEEILDALRTIIDGAEGRDLTEQEATRYERLEARLLYLRSQQSSSVPVEPTRAQLVRDFDYEEAIGSPQHEAFRKAMNDYANIGWPSLGRFAEMAKDFALAARYADCCNCFRGKLPHGRNYTGNRWDCRAWPYRIERIDNGSRVRCSFYCYCCGNSWRCLYSIDPARIGA